MNSAKTCLRKVPYSRKQAQERLVLKTAQTGRGGSIYQCGQCGWWHLTKQQARKEQN